MGKTKVKVLYPSGFPADVELYKQKDGRDVAIDVVEMESDLADALIEMGYAEAVKAAAKKAGD